MPVKGFDKYPISEYLGVKFGEWTVVRFSHRNSSGHSVWVCQCSCGAEKNVNRTDLFNGKSVRCRNCAACTYDNTGLVKSWYVTRVSHGAKGREIEFDLTTQQMTDIWIEQNGCCALTGVELHLGQHVRDPQTASLDRIDSKRGYVYDNVQWVHKKINALKNDFDQDEFLELCRLVTNFHS